MGWLKKLFGWFIWKRKPPERSPITEEQLKSRVIHSIHRVFLERGMSTGYDLLDAKNLVLKYFIDDCPYKIDKKTIIRAKKMIDRHQSMLSGKLI